MNKVLSHSLSASLGAAVVLAIGAMCWPDPAAQPAAPVAVSPNSPTDVAVAPEMPSVPNTVVAASTAKAHKNLTQVEQAPKSDEGGFYDEEGVWHGDPVGPPILVQDFDPKDLNSIRIYRQPTKPRPKP